MNPSFMHGPWGGAVGFGPFGGMFGAGFAVFAVIAIIWELFWAGLALWHSARNKQTVWFVVFLLVHTLGILEIIYLFGFRADRKTNPLFGHSNPSSTPTTPPTPPSSSSAA